MKIKISILIFLFALTASAVEILPVDFPQIQETFLQKIIRCKWRVSCYKQKLGATITTINATDLISASRATINTNFSNLNSGKVEESDLGASTTMSQLTTLVNVTQLGVIASSTWRGSLISVPYGGTGTSSIQANRIILGNGSGAFSVVNGFGTSGQFLTSNGVDAAPTWTTSSIDQALSYNFTGTSVRIKNLHASSTSANPITLNGVAYNTSSAQGASSTVLKNNGSGALVWNPISATTTVFTTTGTSTMAIPTGIQMVKITLVGAGGGGGGVSQAGGNDAGGGGGGGGGTAIDWVDVSGFSGTATIFVGSGGEAGTGSGDAGGKGTDTTFGASGTSISTRAVGGSGGGGSNGSSEGSGGGGGGTINADISLDGQGGTAGGSGGAPTAGGGGGDSFMGYGAQPVVNTDGGAGSNYGGGGSGGENNTSTQGGGAGAQGIAIIEWIE